ncbi:MAG: ABC transporter permease, partial [Spirochaetota bacterium]
MKPGRKIDWSLSIQRIYFAIFFFYIIAPIIVIMIIAFNDSKLPTLPLKGFTLKWFPVMFQNDRLIKSLFTSLLVGAGTTSISLFFGITSAFVFVRKRFAGENFFYFLA